MNQIQYKGMLESKEKIRKPRAMTANKFLMYIEINKVKMLAIK